MKITTILAVLALSLAPTLSMAQCMHQQQMKSASQCAPGEVWDAATQTCSTPANS